jgi:hypothetical protein
LEASSPVRTLMLAGLLNGPQRSKARLRLVLAGQIQKD